MADLGWKFWLAMALLTAAHVARTLWAQRRRSAAAAADGEDGDDGDAPQPCLRCEPDHGRYPPNEAAHVVEGWPLCEPCYAEWAARRQAESAPVQLRVRRPGPAWRLEFPGRLVPTRAERGSAGGGGGGGVDQGDGDGRREVA